ncbi:TatD family hydrolase [Helicobacter sp.]|uniref:TatD family hydrolase n=1 Tax=Helicobacter sp. TaxID=218 RepID=UPI0025C2A5CC|nr:TatD family hydrolase [Helicobacter sp.]MCI5967897.1 TatD family hydrolase [Helicobacter sp.]MDY2584808.1 TatD family hydrolase [Helicobacter sp.]
MQLCDTHCHLDDARFDTDFNAMLERAQNAGISRFIIPAADPKDLQKAQKLANAHTNVYFASGVHPDLAYAYDSKFVESFLSDSKCVAIGECGLDYYRLDEKLEDFNTDSTEEIKTTQKRVFREQIELAIKLKKPLIVHIREASNDSLEILQTYAKDLVGGVLHCFNADFQLLKLAPFNFYYGIGGVLTFKNARKLVEILPKIPLKSLLLETDAPYLTPHPHRGKRNEPSYIPLVLEKMQEILEIPKEQLIAQINANTTRLFALS